MHPVIWLIAAIGSEVIATTSLKLSEGFTRPLPAVAVVVGYGISFYALAQSLRTIPLGVVYAVWSGIGTAAIALIGLWLFRETFDIPKVVGIAFIIAGVALLNLVSSPSAV